MEENKKQINNLIIKNNHLRPIFSLNPKNIENVLNFNELRIYIYLSRSQGLNLTKGLDDKLFKECHKYLNISLTDYLTSINKLIDLELIYFDKDDKEYYLTFKRDVYE